MAAPGTGIIEAELEALKAGDEAAFRTLIQRYHGPILRLAMAYVRDREAAEDVVQETWLAVLRGLRPVLAAPRPYCRQLPDSPDYPGFARELKPVRPDYPNLAA